ncbi:MAG: FAD-dependent oxidoreductase [Eubacteriales bacterium]|nr:FAD-dependent oxidoreductase [Eubacteriales bacterium]
MHKIDIDIQALMDYFGTWYQDDEKVAEARISQQLYPYTKLFQPIHMNRLELKNRLVMAPMGNINMGEEAGRPSSSMVAYFEERAKGGVGLITSGLIPVSQGLDPSLLEKDNLSYFPRISGNRVFNSGWRDIARACQAQGSAFFIQLTAGLGRVGSPECVQTHKKFPRSASFNPNFYVPNVTCFRFSDRTLKKIVKRMGQAALDAKAMGIDGVYLHAHEGYLMEQLANPAYNRRSFGRYSDPKRFGLDIVEEIRKQVGPNYPIMFRIDLSLALNECYGDRMTSDKVLKKFAAGRTPEETLTYMEALIEAGVDAFDVDLGCYENWWLPHPPTYMPPACFRQVAAYCKSHLADKGLKSKAGYEIPVVAVGKLGNPDVAEDVLREEQADMVMLGRPLLADPYWPKKAYAGQAKYIRPCIGCQDACVHEFVEGGRPQCTVNPRCSFEDKFPRELALSRNPKKIAVAGAGPAGMEAALTLWQRGNEVYLYDAADKPGGTVRYGIHGGYKVDLENLLSWYEARLAVAVESPSFHYFPGTLASVSLLEDERFDIILCATGAKARTLSFEGADQAVSGIAFCQKPELAEGKKNIVIVGAGSIGMELALGLSDDPERKVTLVEAGPYAMQNVCTANRGYLLHYLQEKGGQLYNCSQALGYKNGEFRFKQNVSKTVPDPWVTWTPVLADNVNNPFRTPLREEWQERSIPCDLCIVAVGSKADDQLYKDLVTNYCAPEVRKLGDADRPATIRQAIHAGYRLGISL